VSRDPVALPLWALGTVFVLLGAWAAAGSRSFARVLADFGPLNDHLVHDYGAASVAIGSGLLISARLVAWRTPALTIAAIWNGLHLVSHVADLGRAGSRALGLTEVGLLVIATGLLAWFARTSRRSP